MNEKYVDASEQLIVELYVRDLAGSCVFYQALGFKMVREEEDFVEMQWEGTRFMLDAGHDVPAPPKFPVGNIRIMVADVDDYWMLAKKIGAQVIHPIENRSYGLRDFTIAGPDGLGLRFATRLSDL